MAAALSSPVPSAASRPRRISVVVTGFGRFLDVRENPTAQLMSDLRNSLEKRPLKHTARCNVSGFNVIVVSARASEMELQKLSAPGANNADTLPVFVHFGVHTGAKTFLIERQAFNEATFRGIDEGGEARNLSRIDKLHPLEHRLVTPLDVSALCKTLTAAGHKVAESDDAGRFICNYLYYLSLKQFKDAGRGVSLFVHVPSFETLPQEQHLAFARDLLDTITEQLCDA